MNNAYCGAWVMCSSQGSHLVFQFLIVSVHIKHCIVCWSKQKNPAETMLFVTILYMSCCAWNDSLRCSQELYKLYLEVYSVLVRMGMNRCSPFFFFFLLVDVLDFDGWCWRLQSLIGCRIFGFHEIVIGYSMASSGQMSFCCSVVIVPCGEDYLIDEIRPCNCSPFCILMWIGYLKDIL